MAAAPFGALRFGRYWRTAPVKREQGRGHIAGHHALAAPATVCRPPPHASRAQRLPPLDFFCASPRDAGQTVWEGGVWIHGFTHASPASPETGPPITFSPLRAAGLATTVCGVWIAAKKRSCRAPMSACLRPRSRPIRRFQLLDDMRPLSLFASALNAPCGCAPRLGCVRHVQH